MSTWRAPPSGAVRHAGPDDVDRVSELWLALARDHARLDPAFEIQPDAGVVFRRELARDLEDPRVAVLVWEPGEEGVAGFARVAVALGSPVLAETGRAEITELVVEPGRRRGGGGRVLVEAAVAWAFAQGASRVEARVAHRNPDARAFWRALGFGDYVAVLARRE